MTLDKVKQALAQAIVNSPNPEEAARIAVDVLYRRTAGESMVDIAASYGLVWEEVAKGD